MYQVALLCAVYHLRFKRSLLKCKGRNTRVCAHVVAAMGSGWYYTWQLKCKGNMNVPTAPDLSASIKKIQLPPRVAKRGVLTVIGLPAKRSAHDVSATPFSKKTSEKKKKIWHGFYQPTKVIHTLARLLILKKCSTIVHLDKVVNLERVHAKILWTQRMKGSI